MVELSVVIPCYNSSKSLEELSLRLDNSLQKLKISYEVIFVNDYSKDSTLVVAKEIVEEYESFRVIDMMFNVGQAKALYCGLENSNGEYVVTMDDDLEHKPEDIVKLYNKINSDKNIDVVFGNRMEKKHSALRKFGSFMIGKLNEKIFNKPKDISLSPFRILRKKLVDTIISHRTMFPIIGLMILKSTRRMSSINIEHQSRKYGESNYSLAMLVKITFDNIINFSSLPLKYISYIGLSASLLSFFLALIYILKYFIFGVSVSGWTTLVVLINFYSGLILLSIGIIGEYLIRILSEVQGYPIYKIRDIYE